MCKSSTVGWLCFLVVIAVSIQVRGQTPEAPSGQPLPTTGTTESRIGPRAFEGGYPTDATVTRLYDEMDFQRVTQCYFWAVPIVSFMKWQEQHETVFGQEDGDLVVTVSSREKMGILTPNDTTPYLVGFVNLARTGPLVIDYPKGPTAGGVLDMWQRLITDLGLSGPDKGEGGKYLILPPGQKDPKDAEGYRIFESPTNNIFHEFMNNGELTRDYRTLMHYMATGITPAMAQSAVGQGSAYAFTPHDAEGRYLDGGKTCGVTLPAPVPAKDFWSFVVYSGQHRSLLETDQRSAGIDSKNPNLQANPDGSYTVYFGPKPPPGKEGNWVQTMPGKSWSTLLRLYGPLEPWFKKPRIRVTSS